MNTGPSVSRPPITLGLLVAALLLLVLPQTAAARAITWEGDLQITDSYQHNLALAPGGAYTGSGTTTSNISHSYEVPRQTTEVAPGSGPITVPISYNAAPVAASFSGSLTVRGPDCGGFTRTDTLSGAGTATTVAPNTGNFSYDPATDKLALEPVFNTRQIVIPAATRAVQSGFPCPGQNPQPQNLGLGTPRYLDTGAAGDYRLDVRRDGIDLYVEGLQEFSFIGGQPAVAGFGLPVGSTGNFLTLTGAPTVSIGLIEQVSYNLHGTLTEDPVTLTVEKTGAGTATVQSQPAGIDCGADCQARFERNSAAVLEADLFDNTKIVRWEGVTGCGTETTCQVPMDQDKTVRLVLEAQDCTTTNATATPEWSARVVIDRFPDAELFRFSPSFSYCSDQDSAKVTGAAGFGTVDFGIDTGLLAAFGFDLAYDPAEEHVSFGGNQGRVTGDFEFRFNTLTLLNRFGFSTLTNKIIKDQLEKKLVKLLPKFGYGSNAKGVIADYVAKLRFQAEEKIAKEANKARRKFARILGDDLAAKLTGFAVEKLNGTLAAWQAEITSTLSTEQFAEKTAGQITDSIAQRLLARLEEAITYEESVWTPTATIVVAPGGAPPNISIAGFANPFLTIRRER